MTDVMPPNSVVRVSLVGTLLAAVISLTIGAATVYFPMVARVDAIEMQADARLVQIERDVARIEADQRLIIANAVKTTDEIMKKLDQMTEAINALRVSLATLSRADQRGESRPTITR